MKRKNKREIYRSKSSRLRCGASGDRELLLPFPFCFPVIKSSMCKGAERGPRWMWGRVLSSQSSCDVTHIEHPIEEMVWKIDVLISSLHDECDRCGS